MIWHYDHRYGTYEGVRDRSSTQLPTPDERQHADPHFVVQPWYWVRAEEVASPPGRVATRLAARLPQCNQRHQRTHCCFWIAAKGGGR
jgi:hypothetical protein